MRDTPFLLDMVHDNPGDRPFETAFREPDTLVRYGFNGQVFKHLNCVLTLEKADTVAFPTSEEEQTWLHTMRSSIREQIAAAKRAGLEVYYHVDLFVLPKCVVEAEREAICDAQGRISIRRERTRELHRALLDELFESFPEVDGLIVRIGETYLFDTPHHTGNGAVPYGEDVPHAEQIDDFIELINFLREEICERHERWYIHRSWDYWQDRFHASLSYYLAVTDAIEPHSKLLFSIKHSVTDFFRWTGENPCIGKGRHPQLIEVQCQREYEGKGAYPNYSSHGVLKGFPEMEGEGIARWLDHPQIRGLYNWSRGGGWHGPILKDETWCALNAWVVVQAFLKKGGDEAKHMASFCSKILGLNPADTQVFRQIALASIEAIPMGLCASAWDSRQAATANPCNFWIRDDCLGGHLQLDTVILGLRREGLWEQALEEKREARRRWTKMRQLADTFSMDVPEKLRASLVGSTEYGLRLFTLIEASWRLSGELLQGVRSDSLKQASRDCKRALEAYRQLPVDYPECATLYHGSGWALPGESAVTEGLDASLAEACSLLTRLTMESESRLTT